MRRPLAALIAVTAFVVVTPVAMLMGAFVLRLLLGVSTYRSSGVWVVVVGGAPVVAAVVSVLLFRLLTRLDR